MDMPMPAKGLAARSAALAPAGLHRREDSSPRRERRGAAAHVGLLADDLIDGLA